MNIHEFQAKEILSSFHVEVPRGRIVTSADEAFDAARSLGGVVAVKAQIHAGGRGKAGGVNIARSPSEAEQIAGSMLGTTLITPQTGSEGRVVRRVLIEEGLDIAQEFYLGLTIDRSAKRPVLMASREGGVEIEEVARRDPGLILKEWIHPAFGLQPYQARNIAHGLGLDVKLTRQAYAFMVALHAAFRDTDASLTEINPLVVTHEDKLVALDAKMNFDDNALYRQKQIAEMRDYSEEQSLEIRASRHGLSYIKLDGNVGCMVNGAGLAMATMDIIKLEGGEPANFLDVGGGASVEQVKNAFQILISDGGVKAVLINIFGGIMRCDIVATGVVEAAGDIGVNVPVVVRLQGTNVEKGRQILRDSSFDFEVADGMKDAAEKVCRLASSPGS